MSAFRLAAVMLFLAVANQPSHAFDDYVADSEPDPAPYLLAGAVGASAASFLAIALNVAPNDVHRQHPGELGKFAVGAGIAGLGLGLAAFIAGDQGAEGLGAFSMAMGAASMVIGIRHLTGGTDERSGEETITGGITLAAAPFVGYSGRGSGAALQLRF